VKVTLKQADVDCLRSRER